MYTQCAKCETVFKLSAEVLRAAGGQVRCGRCGEVFNALARLAEDASAFSAGESPLEMEARADEILHSTGAHAVDGTTDAAGDDLAAARRGVRATPGRGTVREVRRAPDAARTGFTCLRLSTLIESVEITISPSPRRARPSRMWRRAMQDLLRRGRARVHAAAGAAATASLSNPDRRRCRAHAAARRPPNRHIRRSRRRLETASRAPHDRTGGLEVSEDVRRDMLVGIARRRRLPELDGAGDGRGLPFAVWLRRGDLAGAAAWARR